MAFGLGNSNFARLSTNVFFADGIQPFDLLSSTKTARVLMMKRIIKKIV
jgi:hypothetical protein